MGKMTINEAEEEINRILGKYSDSCGITFRKRDAEITDSYLVTSRDDRLKICGILVTSGITSRTAQNLSAEWYLHNVSWKAHFMRFAARDVSLDYNKDPRTVVRVCTRIFEKLGWV